MNVAHPAGSGRSYTRSRRGKIGVGAYLAPEQWAALHRLAAERDMAICWLAAEAIESLIAHYAAGAEVQAQKARAA